MKMLFTIPRLVYSGAPKILAWIANNMAKKGHEVTILTFFKSNIEKEISENVTVTSLDIKQSKNWFIRNTFGMLKINHILHKNVNEINPDVIISFIDSVSLLYLLKNRFSKKRKIVVSERADPYQIKGIMSKIRFGLMKNASWSVFQTDGAREFFKGKIFEKSSVIPNPVILENSDNPGEEKIDFSMRDNRIVSVGRLSLTQKRQDVLINAFKIVLEKHPEMQLVFYGDGQDRAKIESIIKENGLENKVILAGVTKDVKESIKKAKVFVLSSDFEGIPNALIEAMQYGVPSVSTDCSPGGARLLINDGENGFIVPCGNIEKLAEKINILIENSEISNKFSKSSPKICETFSEEKIANMWEDCFIKIRDKK
ncbi:MAG: glycosyltransferase [Clostridia bacterium]|nr:glycosyltransferase [Clostridia bacterium]